MTARNVLRLGVGGTTLAWMGLIFYLSSISQAETPKVPLLGSWQSVLGHLALYGVCACLVEGSIWSWGCGFRFRWALAAAATATAYGISDEFHQSFVTGRHATVEDVLVNTVAAIAAAALLWSLGARLERRNTTGSQRPSRHV